MKYKELKRSSKNKVFLGVIGGLSEYFGTDPILSRLIFIILLIVTGFFPFGIAYFIAAIVMPKDIKKDPIKVKIVKEDIVSE